MRPRIRALLAAALAFGTVASVWAAESADLSLVGEIRPTACTLSLSRSTIDYGTISASALSNTAPTALAQTPFEATIVCDAPTLTALPFHDNRAGSEGHASMSADTWFGLGQTSGRPVGAFQIVRTPASVVANGTSVQTIELSRSGTWLQMNETYPEVSARSGYRLSWAGSGTTPMAYDNVVIPLAISPTLIGRQDMAPLVDGVSLDGLATISLVYL